MLYRRKLQQGLGDEGDNKVVLVTPPELVDKSVPNCNLSHLSRVKERDLICAAFSGHLDPSIIVAAPGKNCRLLVSFLNYSGEVHFAH